MCSSWTCRPTRSPLFITDAAINIFPDLATKVDIVQNAIDLHLGPGTGRAARGHPVGGRDGQPEDARHARRRRLVQDGRSRPDQGRHARRPAGAGQRDQPGGRADQGHRLPGGGPGADPGRARPRGRQHAGQEPVVHGQRRRGRHRARGARADHPDQPRRQCPHPHGVLRGGGALCPRPPRGAPRRRRHDRRGRHAAGRQCRLVEHQVPAVRRHRRRPAAGSRSRVSSRASAPGRISPPRMPAGRAWSTRRTRRAR